MSDLLSIGSSGITAYQRALATVSNNIANVTTDGYSRQNTTINANTPTRVGGDYLGTGAIFEGVRRQYDAFVDLNLRSSTSDLQAQEPLVSYVNRLIDIMGDQSIGLTSAMNQFFESARDLATDAASTIQRSTFLRSADGLAARFRELDNQFELIDNETRQAVQTGIGQINSLTTQVADINRQLAKHTTESEQPAELLDQRDKLLRDLSALTAIKTSFKADGTVLVSVGDTTSQGVLVDGQKARAIGLAPASGNDARTLQFVIDPYGSPESLPSLLSGSVGGTLSFREHVLAPATEALDHLASTLAAQANAVHRTGVDLHGNVGGDLFRIDSTPRGAAAGIAVAISDGNKVAAASQFRVIDDPLNTGDALATVQWDGASTLSPATLREALADARAPQVSGERVGILGSRGYASLGAAPLGMENLVLTLSQPAAGQGLVVLTRDGRQLLGEPMTAKQQADILQPANGFESGASYQDTTAPAGSRFLGMDLFLGARAGVQMLQQFDPDTGRPAAPAPAPAVLDGRALAAGATGAIGAIGAIDSGTFVLNGVALDALTGAADPASPTAAEVAGWINGYTARTGVTASLNAAGGLRLSNTSGDVMKDVRLGTGASGHASDLARLGFDQAFHLVGAATDDLLVFATGPEGSVDVTAQYTAASGDAQAGLREQVLQVVFTSGTRYQIVAKGQGGAADTLVAERAYDPAAGEVRYRNLVVTLAGTPREGDRFTIDGNRDGVGNNESMLALADLENQRLMAGGQTMTEAYIERVSLVGNMAQQAAVSRDALQVVFDQALQARDTVAGVSLDEEAADLVRFQQAYQANAKVMQVATQLFDAILQVN